MLSLWSKSRFVSKIMILQSFRFPKNRFFDENIFFDQIQNVYMCVFLLKLINFQLKKRESELESNRNQNELEPTEPKPNQSNPVVCMFTVSVRFRCFTVCFKSERWEFSKTDVLVFANLSAWQRGNRVDMFESRFSHRFRFTSRRVVYEAKHTCCPPRSDPR